MIIIGAPRMSARAACETLPVEEIGDQGQPAQAHGNLGTKRAGLDVGAHTIAAQRRYWA
jgi:hypothetical protein